VPTFVISELQLQL